METRNILNFITKTLDDRFNGNFMPLKIQNILNAPTENTKIEFAKFSMNFYREVKTYIEKWIKPLQQFDKFEWMFLPNITENTPWTAIEITVLFLEKNNIDIDEIKLLDEWVNLKAFSLNLSEQDKVLTTNQLWLNFFKKPNANLYTELIKIAQYFFAYQLVMPT